MTQRYHNRVRGLVLTLCFALCLVAAQPALADSRHNPKRGGHPLRFIAYVLHPVGYLLDAVLVRPLHWVASQDGIDEVVGHTDR